MGATASCPSCRERPVLEDDGADDDVGQHDSSPLMIELSAQIEEANEGVDLNRQVSKETEHVGDTHVPRHGDGEAKSFKIQNLLEMCLSQCKDMFAKEYVVSIESVAADLVDQNENRISCAISDPTGHDCPLVYVSPYFEAMTGYPSRQRRFNLTFENSTI